MTESRPLNPLAPLEKFYRRAALPLPPVEWLPGAAMPEPQRSLLFHERDMTSTLERFHGAPCRVRVLQSHQTPLYERLVVLQREGDALPVEFGAIDIYFEPFSEAARAQILGGERPLGAILNAEQINYVSCPRAFFRIEADALIAEALKITLPASLFGRCNRLSTGDGRMIAEIVEILP